MTYRRILIDKDGDPWIEFPVGSGKFYCLDEWTLEDIQDTGSIPHTVAEIEQLQGTPLCEAGPPITPHNSHLPAESDSASQV